MIREMDSRIAAIDLNGSHIIRDCKAMLVFLRKQLIELKALTESTLFRDEAEEISFFKHHKPTLLGQLIYFHEILRIESQRPIGDDELDTYYEKRQEEQKLFFDRHVAFFQYYRSGATYMDKYYFLRGKQENIVNMDVCHLDDDSAFSTGYDHLVARIMAMEMLYAFLSVKRTNLRNGGENMSTELLKVKGFYKWTGTAIELVEIVYGLSEMDSINNGETPIHELAAFIGTLLNIDIRDCYSAYTDMKRRKNVSRTYFLDKMQERLNKRMEQDDDKEQKRK
ncbi:RteC domain-containing protein [Culturomica sp.]|uniref:RteC domain-containing protein n=1 Tax=Culturomica sp. TaxID=1926652 RepID=UPI000E8C0DB0|nr:RteC domain-containing protein [Culturomica sp.]HBO26273.1 hypothetical protein [Culturomica sp.]